MITITICYATPEKQVLITLEVEKSCTIDMAIKRSSIMQQCPEIKLSDCTVGIFGQRVRLDSNVQMGDRIEIYRPLTLDPKEARRVRAQR